MKQERLNALSKMYIHHGSLWDEQYVAEQVLNVFARKNAKKKFVS